MATHELTTAGARTAYLPESLPALFEDQEPTEFGSPEYENLRNCISGLASIFDRHVRETAAVKKDPRWQDFSPSSRQERISDALAKVNAETLKGVERLERVADGAGKEAADLDAWLTNAEAPRAARAEMLANYQALPRDRQVVLIYDLTHRLAANSGVDAAERAAAREYLSALAATDPTDRLLDERSRKLVNRALARSKDPAKYQRARHLSLASRAIKESAARVRGLVERG